MDSRDLCLNHHTGDLGYSSMHTQTCFRNQKLTVQILLIDIQTQVGSDITYEILTIRQEFC